VTILQKAAGKPTDGKQTTSLRITVPAFIIDVLKLKKGDKLEWGFDGETITARRFKEDHNEK